MDPFFDLSNFRLRFDVSESGVNNMGESPFRFVSSRMPMPNLFTEEPIGIPVPYRPSDESPETSRRTLEHFFDKIPKVDLERERFEEAALAIEKEEALHATMLEHDIEFEREKEANRSSNEREGRQGDNAQGPPQVISTASRVPLFENSSVSSFSRPIGRGCGRGLLSWACEEEDWDEAAIPSTSTRPMPVGRAARLLDALSARKRPFSP